MLRNVSANAIQDETVISLANMHSAEPVLQTLL